VAERERDDLLLDHHRQLVRHQRPAALAWPEHLKALTVDGDLPAVIGRAVHTHHPARLRDADLARQRKESQAIAEQHVILSHADSSPFGWHRGA
jgi:hypothetical protein